MRNGTMKTKTLTYASVALASLALGATALPAQQENRQTGPTGQEIAEKAKAAKLAVENTSEGIVHGKKVRLTPAAPPSQRTDAAAGQILGVLDTEAPGDETGLKPGKYNLYLAQVGGKWHGYAESGGQIVTEAVRVTVQKLDQEPTRKKPEFRERGWCFDSGVWYWAFGWFQVVFCF